ncbi:MAG: hypothetical protein GY861_09880 [bacterium]|nr:hypothetical protein [bacterium]
MPIDIVIPSKNEKQFIEIAEKLGYSELCFAYTSKQNIAKLQEKTELKLSTAQIVKNKDARKAHADLIIVKAMPEENAPFENKVADIILGAEKINQVMLNLAKKNKTLVAFSFADILNESKRTRAMGLVSKNIKFCRKYKTTTLIASFAKKPYEMCSPHDLASLFASLGMHPKEAADSLEAASKKMAYKRFKKSPEYITEGVRIVKTPKGL